MKKRVHLLSLAASLVALSAAVACGSNRYSNPAPIAAPDRGRATSAVGGDQGRCDYKGREDREAIETTGPGSLLPNVRRVYQIVVLGEERRRVLVCREIDTNLDGLKDVIRTFNDKGEVQQEEADSNYDGKIDTWLSFAGGRLSKESRDTNNDGQPDVWKYFVIDDDPNAKEKNPNAPIRLQRVQRDKNFDGKPDIWEFYDRGRLERMGQDLDFDGRVDRWDHDEMARQIQNERERAAERAAAATDGGAPDGGPADAGASDGGADGGSLPTALAKARRAHRAPTSAVGASLRHSRKMRLKALLPQGFLRASAACAAQAAPHSAGLSAAVWPLAPTAKVGAACR